MVNKALLPKHDDVHGNVYDGGVSGPAGCARNGRTCPCYRYRFGRNHFGGAHIRTRTDARGRSPDRQALPETPQRPDR